MGHGDEVLIAQTSKPVRAFEIVPAGGLFAIVRSLMARILLIEDDDGVRTVLRRMLEQAGHPVIEARDGKEGLGLPNGPSPTW